MEGFPGLERARKSADELVEEARSIIGPRLSPHDAHEGMELGQVVLIDIRPYEQQMGGGMIPGAIVIDSNVFEFRCDPAQPDKYRDPAVTAVDYDQCLVVICNQGYQSSLNAAGLRRMGLYRATDVAGGMEAWIAAGLPVIPYPEQP